MTKRKPLQIHTHTWHDAKHHAEGAGFRNPWPLPPSEDDEPDKAPWQFLIRHFLGSKEQTPAPSTPLDPSDLKADVADRSVRITWLGHSTVLVQYPGLTLLTDPVWGKRAGPFEMAGPKREVPPPLSLKDLPPVDVVVLSHNHYDHLDKRALGWLHRHHDPLFLVPLGVEKHLPGNARTASFDWHQYADLNGVRIHCAPARHFSARTPWDRNRTLWASWYLEPLNDAALTVYFAADSGYASHFAEIRERLGSPEVVLMPIGAYRPRWMMRPVHVNPSEALQAFSDLGAGTLIPIHWGTYDLAEELLHEPPDVLLKEAEKTELRNAIEVLPVGGQLLFGEG